jgi:hypothetical protein
MLKGSSVEMVVMPMRQSWRKVLYLDTVVGLTSADGLEKSQKRWKVFWRKRQAASAGTGYARAARGSCSASRRRRWRGRGLGLR